MNRATTNAYREIINKEFHDEEPKQKHDHVALTYHSTAILTTMPRK
jgi:hypothetical protein